MSSPLFDATGRRLYVTQSERDAVIEAARWMDRDVRTFCLTLAYTGCRISEALALTGQSIDFSNQAVVIETLKKRRSGVYRAVPVPPSFLETMDSVHGLTEATRKRRKKLLEVPLWEFSRTTAWRHILSVMEQANLPDGPHRSPKGLRHGFGVIAITNGIPLNLVSRWMGHASLEVTAIYANALGEEQRQLASKMW